MSGHIAPVRTNVDTSRPRSPQEAVDLLTRHALVVVEEEAASDPTGRVLAAPVRADRDQPPVDVSLMDGYAVRALRTGAGRHPVTGESRAGSNPGAMPASGVVRIVTGAALPSGADAVVKREDVVEGDGVVTISPAVAARTRAGQCVRTRALSARAGDALIERGAHVGPSVRAALALVGAMAVRVFRRASVALLATGDEVVADDAPGVTDWQVRDASAPALTAMFAGAPWCEPLGVERVPDDLEALSRAMRSAAECSDMVLLTGGVSKGHRDFVPGAIEAIGGRILFHRLPQRPGHPTLGALSRDGKPILGLPGNPLSTMCVARRIGASVAAHVAGMTRATPPTLVRLTEPLERPVADWRFRPVRLTGNGLAAQVDITGSADVAAAARSDGFVEVPPGGHGAGPWAYYAWGVG